MRSFKDYFAGYYDYFLKKLGTNSIYKLSRMIRRFDTLDVFKNRMDTFDKAFG